jgi:Leucine-rich repeat (LRR) protein
VSDTGLRNLVNLPLSNIQLDYSRVSARGFASLRNGFPGAGIIGEPRASLAEDLLAGGAILVIRAGDGKEDRLVKRVADRPRERFLVRRLDCTGVKTPLAELLARLNHWREYEFERLEALDLSGCAIDRLGFTPPEGLQELNASDTKMADLQPLFGLKRLRKLSLGRAPVSSLSPVAGLTNLEELSLAGTSIADDALHALENLPNLRKLDLDQTAITGRGLGHLAGPPKLAELSLAGSKVSDLFAAEVGTLTKLERLSLAGCTFSDAGLKHLAGLGNLRELDLRGTNVTAEGTAALAKALPKCKILTGPAPK